MTTEFVIAPAKVCEQRGHPIKRTPGRIHCLICTLIWKIGGDEAVTDARRDQLQEVYWMMHVRRPDGSIGPMARG